MQKFLLAVIASALVPGSALLSAAQNGVRPRVAAVTYPHLPSAAYGAMETISADRIRAQVRFLSHDLLEGRGTGQRGGDIAAEYIATQFATYGLKPAGEHGTYFQKVPMVGITPEAATTPAPAAASAAR